MVSNFWHLKEFKLTVPFTIEEKEFNAIFERAISRNENGRFVVNLSFRNDDKKEIGWSYEIAKSWFLFLEK